MKQRVLLKGKDALDLLHRISSVDLKRTQLNEPCEGLILNPQGKILSYFTLTRESENDVLVDFEGEFLSLLDQYTFGEKYEIIPQLSPPSPAASELERIKLLKPLFGREFKSDGTSNPLEVNLSSAIHDQKGCYPGQEVIEKILSLGSPARRLCLLATDEISEISCPATLFGPDGQEAGTLTSFEKTLGLAVLKRPHAVEHKKLSAVDHHQKSISLTVQKVSP